MTSLNFGLTLPDSQLPELLRRVASEIEAIDGFSLLNIVVSEHEAEVWATVYYWIDKTAL
jgi:hypothetical protein